MTIRFLKIQSNDKAQVLKSVTVPRCHGYGLVLKQKRLTIYKKSNCPNSISSTCVLFVRSILKRKPCTVYLFQQHVSLNRMNVLYYEHKIYFTNLALISSTVQNNNKTQITKKCTTRTPRKPYQVVNLNPNQSFTSFNIITYNFSSPFYQLNGKPLYRYRNTNFCRLPVAYQRHGLQCNHTNTYHPALHAHIQCLITFLC